MFSFPHREVFILTLEANFVPVVKNNPETSNKSFYFLFAPSCLNGPVFLMIL